VLDPLDWDQFPDAIEGAFALIADIADTGAGGSTTIWERAILASSDARADGQDSAVIASAGGAGIVRVSGTASAAVGVSDNSSIDGLCNVALASREVTMGAGDGHSAVIACDAPLTNGTAAYAAQVGCSGSCVSGTESLLVGSDDAELNDDRTIGIGPGTGAPLVPGGANQGIETKIKAHGVTIDDPATDATATVAAVPLVAPLTYTAALDSACGIITTITLGAAGGLPADTEAGVAMTNNRVAADSVVLAAVDYAGFAGAPGIVRVQNGVAGIVSFIIRNFDPIAACNGDAEIRFVILNPA
jgi:hypothetical protein